MICWYVSMKDNKTQDPRFKRFTVLKEARAFAREACKDETLTVRLLQLTSEEVIPDESP